MNITSKKQPREEYDQNALDAVRDANQMDLKLYEFVKQRLQKQIDELGSEFAEELTKFRKHNSIYDRTCGVIFRSIRKAKRIARGQPSTA